MTAGNPGPVEPARYLEAIAGSDPLESMRKTAKRIRKLIKGLSEKDAQRPLEDGRWNVRQVLAHLADGELVVATRLRLVAAMDRPPITAYDQDAFAERLGTDRDTCDDLLELFGVVRAANVRLLQRLPQAAFERVGLHSERGEESLRHMVHLYAGHDRVHELQIERLIEALRATRRAKGKSHGAKGKGADGAAAATAAAPERERVKKGEKSKKRDKAARAQAAQAAKSTGDAWMPRAEQPQDASRQKAKKGKGKKGKRRGSSAAGTAAATQAALDALLKS